MFRLFLLYHRTVTYVSVWAEMFRLLLLSAAFATAAARAQQGIVFEDSNTRGGEGKGTVRNEAGRVKKEREQHDSRKGGSGESNTMSLASKGTATPGIGPVRGQQPQPVGE